MPTTCLRDKGCAAPPSMMKDGADDVPTPRERQAPPHQREADAESERRIRLADDRIFSPLAKAFGASATDAEQSRDLIIGTAIEMEEYPDKSEEHTSELQSLMRITYAVFCLTKKKK